MLGLGDGVVIDKNRYSRKRSRVKGVRQSVSGIKIGIILLMIPVWNRICGISATFEVRPRDFDPIGIDKHNIVNQLYSNKNFKNKKK